MRLSNLAKTETATHKTKMTARDFMVLNCNGDLFEARKLVFQYMNMVELPTFLVAANSCATSSDVSWMLEVSLNAGLNLTYCDAKPNDMLYLRAISLYDKRKLNLQVSIIPALTAYLIRGKRKHGEPQELNSLVTTALFRKCMQVPNKHAKFFYAALNTVDTSSPIWFTVMQNIINMQQPASMLNFLADTLMCNEMMARVALLRFMKTPRDRKLLHIVMNRPDMRDGSQITQLGLRSTLDYLTASIYCVKHANWPNVLASVMRKMISPSTACNDHISILMALSGFDELTPANKLDTIAQYLLEAFNEGDCDINEHTACLLLCHTGLSTVDLIHNCMMQQLIDGEYFNETCSVFITLLFFLIQRGADIDLIDDTIHYCLHTEESAAIVVTFNLLHCLHDDGAVYSDNISPAFEDVTASGCEIYEFMRTMFWTDEMMSTVFMLEIDTPDLPVQICALSEELDALRSSNCSNYADRAQEIANKYDRLNIKCCHEIDSHITSCKLPDDVDDGINRKWCDTTNMTHRYVYEEPYMCLVEQHRSVSYIIRILAHDYNRGKEMWSDPYHSGDAWQICGLGVYNSVVLRNICVACHTYVNGYSAEDVMVLLKRYVLIDAAIYVVTEKQLANCLHYTNCNELVRKYIGDFIEGPNRAKCRVRDVLFIDPAVILRLLTVISGGQSRGDARYDFLRAAIW